MRYAWDQFDAYFGPERVGALPSAVLKPVMARLARWDQATAHRPNRYLAISQYVARRIGLYYNRQSAIVYPPVDTEAFTPGDPGQRGAFVIVSALVPYKRLELAIAAAHAAGVPLDIIGDGPEREHLEGLAAGAPGVRLLGRLGDDAVRAHYRSATAVLLPGEEDFGIVPVEAQACGRPVVALGRGGATETVIDGVTGLLVPDDSVRPGPPRFAVPPTPPGTAAASAPTPSASRRPVSAAEFQHAVDESPGGASRRAMVRRYNRLLVVLHVLTDASIGVVAFLLAYLIRFELGVFDVTKGQPPFAQYVNVLPFIAVIVPLGFHLQGLYRLRRGRSRIDVFFNVLVGSIFAVVIGVVGTLYFQAYYVPDELKARGAYEVSQLVWAHLPRLHHRPRLPGPQGRPRDSRAALGLGTRPAPRADRRRRRPRPHGRRPHVRTPRARLPRRRLRRRPRRRRPPRLPRPAAARHAGRGAGDRGARADRPPLRGAADGRARQDARPGRGRQPRVRRREGGARPAAVHRPARPARGPRRHPGHQRQRRAAAGRERRRQARSSTSPSRWSRWP